MFIYLESKLGLNLNLRLTIKLLKFKPNNVFVNKLVCMIFNLSIKKILYVYMYNFKSYIYYRGWKPKLMYWARGPI
jgi:hypothetical protein